MRDHRGVAQATGLSALDRAPQLLPVPLGGLSPARHQPSTLLRHWRRRQPMVMTAAALLIGVCGVWLGLSPATVTVRIGPSGVLVDDSLLTPLAAQSMHGLRVFNGPASLAITDAGGGTSHAGAVMTWNGLATTGQCVLVVVKSGASDTCRFAIGAKRLTAADTFDARNHVWRRHYADGVDIAIQVPAGSALIPVPFPLGR